ncbi:MAG: hypothetical protein ACLP52_30490 [Streptosporangiaceae bacterium]
MPTGDLPSAGQDAAQSQIGRRAFLRGASLLALAGPAVAAAACSSSPSRPAFPAGRPIFGVNDTSWPEISAAAGGVTGWRAYAPPSAGVPRRWPGTHSGPVPAGVQTPVVSIKPDVSQVISGALDARLAAYFSLVPPGAWVTCWHEGEKPGLHFSREQIQRLHARVYSVFRAHAPRTALYGQIFSTYAATRPSSPQALGPWVAPGLDFYGLDGYQYEPGETVEQVLAEPAAQITAVVPGARLAITETNTSFGQQARWFAEAFGLATRQGWLAMFPFFGSGRNYPWHPADLALVAGLRVINQESKRAPRRAAAR